MSSQTLRHSKTQQCVEDYAKQIIQKFAIPKDVELNQIQKKFYPKILVEVGKYTPALLGKIAVAGAGTGRPGRLGLYMVHRKTWLDKYWSGRSLLRAIAATAITAKVYDLIGKD